MSDLNIEVLDKKVVRLSTQRDGSVAIVVSSLVNLSAKSGVDITDLGRGIQDTIFAIIPQNRREIVANFIKDAP